MKSFFLQSGLCACISMFFLFCTANKDTDQISGAIQSEEAIEFVDQSVNENTTVYPSQVPPPPPPPPNPEVEVKPPNQIPNESGKIVPPASRKPIPENQFQSALDQPLSTFSIDVDQASYSIARRYLNNGQLPPQYAIRLEEFVNYFNYDYPQPDGDTPFSVQTEITDCPWANGHKLMMVGLQGKNPPAKTLPPSNLVFLIDVSGSMQSADKIGLLKRSFAMLVDQLRPQDRVAIVTYAGETGVALPSTPGNQKDIILRKLQQLQAGGSTAGAAGIDLAYDIAQRYFMKNGNNRVILATDGDFNVGPSSESELVELIEQKRNAGIFLSVLGFGTGNFRDQQMEQLADHGNGNYAYIDQVLEAKKVMVNEYMGTLYTIAKDVKIQIEFNPAQVYQYRLLGYENRILNKEDFRDDKKDAGDIGAGHSVTALYELVPNGVSPNPSTETKEKIPLRYQERTVRADAASAEWMTVKLRYKKPQASKSQLLSFTASDLGFSFEEGSENIRFAAS
ncbi:MAG: VWA domain-containing protein, partial [Saprospiraceae bacterium]|nr:VWA domain-containing protein [Saprospiraceae bacterium]